MNIDRQGASLALPIGKSTGTVVRPQALQGEPDAAEGELPSFSTVLTAVAGPPDVAPAVAAADNLGVTPNVGEWTDPTSQNLLPDPAILLAHHQAQTSNAILPAAHEDGDELVGLSGAMPSAIAAGLELPIPMPGQGAAVQGFASACHVDGSVPRLQQSGERAPAATANQGARDNSALDTLTAPASRQGAEPERYFARPQYSVSDGANSAPGAAVQPANGDTVPDWRAILDAQSDRGATRAAPTSMDAVSGFKPLPALRSAERQSGRSVFVPLEGLAGGSGTASAYSSGALMGTSAAGVAEAPFAAGSCADVAHKVHYWVTRGVQNAELQLDAFAGGAVDVSISMQGKEALVEFRSDQPEARRMLQDAMPQLREMLRSGGLELSAGFVGTSADPGSQPRRDRDDEGSGGATTVNMPAPTSARTLRTSPSEAHALDVFV
jgi:flagellar hook-length control protein FliK